MSRAARISGTIACLVVVGASACGRDATEPSAPPSGTIRVVVTITGVDLPVRYLAFANGRSAVVDQNGVALLQQISPGPQLVTLQVPANCKSEGENPQTIMVAVGQTAAVAFSVTCQSTTGILRVTAPTTGTDVDADGYTLSVSGYTMARTRFSRDEKIPANGPAVLLTVPVGYLGISISGLSSNCDLAGEVPPVALIEPAKEATYVVRVECTPAGQIALERMLSTGQSVLYLVGENGAGLRRLSPEGSSDQDLAWSGDGARIAFTSDRDGNREIYVANADGSNPRRITNHASPDYRPTWSPDGRKLAFVSERAGTGDPRIFVMNDDGTNVARLTTNITREEDPAWSPDGRIAFTNYRDGKPDVYVMEVGGTLPTRMTAVGGTQPAWSRDGRLAFAAKYCGFYYGCVPAIWVRSTSSEPVALTFATGERPSWSPDGRKIAYLSYDCDFYYVQCASSGAVRIAKLESSRSIELAPGFNAAWRP